MKIKLELIIDTEKDSDTLEKEMRAIMHNTADYQHSDICVDATDEDLVEILVDAPNCSDIAHTRSCVDTLFSYLYGELF